MVTPLFGIEVPVKAHPLAVPEKGSGIAMICTFGDITDLTWWRELSLPVRAVILPYGAFRQIRFGEAGWQSRDAVAAKRWRHGNAGNAGAAISSNRPHHSDERLS